jgi:hypothetical protein
MRGTTPFRLPALVFGAGIAAALTFGANSAVATPREQTANRFFCGYTIDEGSCVGCCGRFQASWEGIECWCETGEGS